VLVIRGGRIIHMGADIGESSFALRGVLCKKILTRCGEWRAGIWRREIVATQSSSDFFQLFILRSKESMFKQKLKAVLQRKLRVLGE